MINLHTKFETSMVSCDENIKGNAKMCQNSRYEPPFGHLGATYRVHLWLDGKHIVDFLLVIVVSLALTTETLLSEICRNRHFLKGWVTLSAKF